MQPPRYHQATAQEEGKPHCASRSHGWFRTPQGCCLGLSPVTLTQVLCDRSCTPRCQHAECECVGCRLDQLLEQVDQGSQVVAVEPIQITEDIAIPRRDSDLTAWVRPPLPSSEGSRSSVACPGRVAGDGSHHVTWLPVCPGRVTRARLLSKAVQHILGNQAVAGCPHACMMGAGAQVNVIHGCNERCTYCVVPNTRGVEQSRTPEAIRVRAPLPCAALHACHSHSACPLHCACPSSSTTAGGDHLVCVRQ